MVDEIKTQVLSDTCIAEKILLKYTLKLSWVKSWIQMLMQLKKLADLYVDLYTRQLRKYLPFGSFYLLKLKQQSKEFCDTLVHRIVEERGLVCFIFLRRK